MIYYLVVIVLIILLIYLRRDRKRLYNMKNGQTMPGMNFISTIYSLYIKKMKGNAYHALYYNQKFGPIYSSNLLITSVVITDPILVKETLKRIDDVVKITFPPYRAIFNKLLVGEKSLGFINHDEWHKHRSIINKVFLRNIIYFDPMLEKIQKCLSIWNQEYNRNHILKDIDSSIQKLTLDILSTCIFGEDFNSLEGNISNIIQAYNLCFKHFYQPIRWIIPFYDYFPLLSNYRLYKSTHEFNLYCWNILNKRLESNRNDLTLSKDMITIMSQNGFNAHEIRQHIGLFFVAGHDTVATTINWLMCWLGKFLDLQDEARRYVLEKVPLEFNFEKLSELDYLDWIIKETLRYSSVVTVLIGRITERDIVLADQWFIPKGTYINIDYYSMLYSKQIWSDPEIFRPSRWSPLFLTEEQRNAWMPFSDGPRICIGKQFAMMQVKIFLVCLLKEFSQFRLIEKDINPVLESPINCPDMSQLHFEFIK